MPQSVYNTVMLKNSQRQRGEEIELVFNLIRRRAASFNMMEHDYLFWEVDHLKFTYTIIHANLERPSCHPSKQLQNHASFTYE